MRWDGVSEWVSAWLKWYDNDMIWYDTFMKNSDLKTNLWELMKKSKLLNSKGDIYIF